jgi:hypothetical protein
LNTTKARLIFLVFIVIAFSLFTYRSIFLGKLLGEPFDARLMISLHEHMWRWLNGLVSFRDTEFFYPYKTALGFSDVFLVQGLLYSIFRFFDLDSLSAWLNVTIILAIIGNLGWILVAKKYLKNYIIQILFILTIISSLSFVHYFTLNPNVVGYAFISWLMIFLINISEEKRVRIFHVKANLFVVVMLIYALSAWYAAFFLVLTLIFRFLVVGFKSKFPYRFTLDKSVVKIYLFFSPIVAFFVWIFYYVYIVVASQPERPIEELITKSPRIQQILSGANPNGGGMDGAIFKNLYEMLHLENPIVYGAKLADWGGGLGIFLPLLFVIVLFVSSFVTKTVKDYSWIIAIALTYLYFMIFGNNLSLHAYLFNVIPGLNSIRSPSRYIIFVGYAAIFMLFYFFDRVILRSKKTLVKILVILSSIVLLLDQQRNSFNGWSRDDFVNTELMALKSEVQNNCDYFYYDRPGGWWYDQIEALTFAVQIGVPTVNGYSGAFPPNYPNISWNEDAPSLEIFDWMKQIEEGIKGCLILGDSNIRYISDSAPSVDFYGFTEEESSGASYWRWAVSNQTYVLIVGEPRARKELEFEIKTAPCFDNLNLDVSLLGEKITILRGLEKDGQKLRLTLNLGDRGAEVLKFSTEVEGCQISGDPRNLFFEIKNLKLI